MAGKLFQKKNREEKDLDHQFAEVYRRIGDLDDWDDPAKIQHYILDSCEQIVSATKEIESERRELRSVSGYLKDIDVLEELPEGKKREIRKQASLVRSLSRQKEAFQNRDPGISEDSFRKMDENREDLPDVIKRMEENEAYQEKEKRDMTYLEGEKARAEMEHSDARDQKKTIRLFAVLLLVSFGVILGLLLFLRESQETDVSWGILLLLAAMAVSAAGIFLKNSRREKKQKRALKQMNNIIQLLNVVRMKYVNVTRALDYVCAEYEVHSASELSYLYEAYQREIASQEEYRRNNRDLTHARDALNEELVSAGLYDLRFWRERPESLSEPEGLEDARSHLEERTKRIRAQMEDNRIAVQRERDEIDRMMNTHHVFVPEVLEIIESVDRICGLNRYKKKTDEKDQKTGNR